MNQYAIYQVPFENDLIRDISFMTPAEIEKVSDQYELVATMRAENLEQVFHFGNMGNHPIDRVGEMHSVSVGDIIHNFDTDETFVVARFGFEKINMKEAA